MLAVNRLTLLLLLGWACAVRSQAAGTGDAGGLKQLQSECIQQSKLSAAESKMVTSGSDKESPAAAATPELKCYYACVYKKTNGFDAAGKPHFENLVKDISTRYPDRKAAFNQPLLNSCLPQNAANDCDKIYDFHVCLIKALKV